MEKKERFASSRWFSDDALSSVATMFLSFHLLCHCLRDLLLTQQLCLMTTWIMGVNQITNPEYLNEHCTDVLVLLSVDYCRRSCMNIALFYFSVAMTNEKGCEGWTTVRKGNENRTRHFDVVLNMTLVMRLGEKHNAQCHIVGVYIVFRFVCLSSFPETPRQPSCDVLLHYLSCREQYAWNFDLLSWSP